PGCEGDCSGVARSADVLPSGSAADNGPVPTAPAASSAASFVPIMSALGNVVRRRMRCRAKSVDQSRGKGDTFRHSTAQQRPQAGNAPRSQIPATHDQTQAGGDAE